MSVLDRMRDREEGDNPVIAAGLFVFDDYSDFPIVQL
jgi:hypothetical protein